MSLLGSHATYAYGYASQATLKIFKKPQEGRGLGQ